MAVKVVVLYCILGKPLLIRYLEQCFTLFCMLFCTDCTLNSSRYRSVPAMPIVESFPGLLGYMWFWSTVECLHLLEYSCWMLGHSVMFLRSCPAQTICGSRLWETNMWSITCLLQVIVLGLSSPVRCCMALCKP